MTDPIPAPFDVAVVGLGIVGVHQITREVEGTVARCTRAFVVDTGHGVIDHVASLGPEVVDLAGMYEVGTDRMITYRHMAAAVIHAALTAPPVCLATYGHPRVYCYPTTLVERAAYLLGLRMTILPGISAFDAICIDLGFDPATNGLQMYDASDLVGRERPLQPDVATLIWQPGVVGEGLFVTMNSQPSRFDELQAYLLRFYPEDHEVTLVMSRAFALGETESTSMPLAQLSAHLRSGLGSGTLYLPPVSERPVVPLALRRLGLLGQ